MAKYFRKISEARAQRLKVYTETVKDGKGANGMDYHKPGSQNRKRAGYGVRSGKR